MLHANHKSNVFNMVLQKAFRLYLPVHQSPLFRVSSREIMFSFQRHSEMRKGFNVLASVKSMTSCQKWWSSRFRGQSNTKHPSRREELASCFIFTISFSPATLSSSSLGILTRSLQGHLDPNWGLLPFGRPTKGGTQETSIKDKRTISAGYSTIWSVIFMLPSSQIHTTDRWSSTQILVSKEKTKVCILFQKDKLGITDIPLPVNTFKLLVDPEAIPSQERTVSIFGTASFSTH